MIGWLMCKDALSCGAPAGLLFVLVLFSPSTLEAVEECPEPFTQEALVARVQTAQSALRAGRLDGAGEQLDRTWERLLCLDSAVPRNLLAQLNYYQAWLNWKREHIKDARASLRNALAIHPELEWDPTLGSPASQAQFLDLLEQARFWRTHQARPVQMRINTRGKDGLLYVDGIAHKKRKETYSTFPGRHLLQKKGRKGWKGAWLKLLPNELAVVENSVFRTDARSRVSRVAAQGADSSDIKSSGRWSLGLASADSTLQPLESGVISSAWTMAGLELSARKVIGATSYVFVAGHLLPLRQSRDVIDRLPIQREGLEARNEAVASVLYDAAVRLELTAGIGRTRRLFRHILGGLSVDLGGVYSFRELLEYHFSETSMVEYVHIGDWLGLKAGTSLVFGGDWTRPGAMGWLLRLSFHGGAGTFLLGDSSEVDDLRTLEDQASGIVPFRQVGVGFGVFWTG